MCIIILNKKNLIDRETIETCFEKNPDGMGIMYVEKNKLNIFKEMDDLDLFYDFYKSVRIANPKSNIGLHFRIATHGNVDTKNTHPFLVNENLGFMHNGIIDIKLSKDSDISDTIAFNESILKNLPKNFLENKAIITLIEKYIGYSKLLFLDSKNHYYIINENLGVWNDGNWYSNYSYCDYKDEFNFDKFLTYDRDYYKKYGFDECEECGRVLKSDLEYESGYCTECMKSYDLI